MYPPTILIEDTDFGSAWARAVRTVLREGVDLTIGDLAEPKPIRDVCGTISLTGNAIIQIENKEVHPQSPFKHIDQYCEEFTREYLKKYLDKPHNERFLYMYVERFAAYGNTDQLHDMQNDVALQISDGITSNRDQMVTWQVGTDGGSDSPPCLQSVLVRYLGDKNLEVHWRFRSRDLFSALQSNVIALVDMLNREVVRPNKCKIVKIVDHSDSLHIYKSDLAAARKVELVSSSPFDRRC